LERPHSRQKLLDFERLRHIVVGSRIQSREPILELSSRRQHQNQHHRALLTYARTNAKSITVGKHPVEDGKIVGAAFESYLGVRGGRANRGHVTLFTNDTFEQLGELRVVFDQER
jgi:hypothetical protein